MPQRYLGNQSQMNIHLLLDSSEPLLAKLGGTAGKSRPFLGRVFVYLDCSIEEE